MGKLIYDTVATAIELDDRTLAHLRIVVMNKFRRDEGFMFDVDHHDGSGHRALWMHSSIPVQFQFYGSRSPRLNRAWIEALMDSANSANGLIIVPEPVEPTPSETDGRRA